MYLKNSLTGQVALSALVVALWNIGMQMAMAGHLFADLFGIAIFVGTLAIICVSYVLAQNQWGLIGPTLVFVFSVILAMKLHQQGIMLAGAGLYAAWARANFVYEKTSGGIPILLALFVSLPLGVPYVLAEPVASGFLRAHGLYGLVERPWVSAVPSLALLVLQMLVVASRREKTTA